MCPEGYELLSSNSDLMRFLVKKKNNEPTGKKNKLISRRLVICTVNNLLHTSIYIAHYDLPTISNDEYKT